jgi:hypothetical protein
MPSLQENYLLLWSIIQHKTDAEKIDWSLVAADLKIDKDKAARLRFTRLKEEFSKMGGFQGLPDKSNGEGMDTKTANPKARAAVEKKSPTKGRKGKVAAKKEEDSEGEGMKLDVKEDVGMDDVEEEEF